MSYFFLFIVSFLFSIVFNLFFVKIGVRCQFFDEPRDDILKIHKNPIPYLGGSGIFLSFFVTLLLFYYFEANLNWKIFGIILGGFLVFLLGFWDDYKWKKFRVKPKLKFFFLILFSFLATLFLFKNGIKIEFLEITIIEIILTFGYIFTLINAINYQDGMDGLAGGLVSISLLGFIIIFLNSSSGLGLFTSLILLGAVLGFLVFNFPPAKIFMGDSGAYFLGFALVVLAAIVSKPYSLPSILAPIFIIGLPIFDGVFTNIRRLLKKESIFLGDREHFYDKLHKKGFSIKKTILTCYSIQVIFIIIGLLITNY